MPIVVAPIGVDLRIVRILTDDKTKQHLGNLGVTVDATIQVLSHEGGAVICRVMDGRLALDKALSTKILVVGAKE